MGSEVEERKAASRPATTTEDSQHEESGAKPRRGGSKVFAKAAAKQARDQEWSDEARFGPVDDIKDFERETGIGPNLAASNRAKLLNANATGYFEIQGSNRGGLGAPLHLGQEIRKDGGSRVVPYEVAYNSYAQPLRMTYRALGRVKDLSMTNAPMTPAELEKNPALMAPFKNMASIDTTSLTAWSAHQNGMATHIMQFHAGQHLLAGAMANYSRVQRKLEAKRRELQRANKLGQIAEVDRAVATVSRIVDVSTQAWSVAGSINQMIGAAALDEHAAHGYDLGEMPKSDPTSGRDWFHGTESDPKGDRADERVDISTKRQKAGAKVETITSGSAEAYALVKKAHMQIAASANFEVSVDDVLKAVIGGSNYVQLKKDVAVLDAQIRKLGLEAEADDVTAATEALDGFKIGFNATKQALRHDRRLARGSAKDFGTKVGGGADTVMVMYAAEAYQELAAFGQLANRQRVELMPLWAKANGYVRDSGWQRFEALNIASDGKHLAENLGDVDAQRKFFKVHLTEWKQTARQWSDFFGRYAGFDLMHKNNAADKVGD